MSYDPPSSNPRIGSGVLLKRPSGRYLLQLNTKEDGCPPEVVGKLRPAGGGWSKRDKDLRETIIRELEEEFGLKRYEVEGHLGYLGRIKEGDFKDCALFILRHHGLEPGTHRASNSKYEKVVLVEADLDDEKYIGPQMKDLDTSTPPWEKEESEQKSAGYEKEEPIAPWNNPNLHRPPHYPNVFPNSAEPSEMVINRAFERAYPQILEAEGGYDAVGTDQGGYTRAGIAESSGIPREVIENLSNEEIRQIYYNKWRNVTRGLRLEDPDNPGEVNPQALAAATALFDLDVNAGYPRRAAIQQGTLNRILEGREGFRPLPENSNPGDRTVAETSKVSDYMQLTRKIRQAHEDLHVSLVKNNPERHGGSEQGWANRRANINSWIEKQVGKPLGLGSEPQENPHSRQKQEAQELPPQEANPFTPRDDLSNAPPQAEEPPEKPPGAISSVSDPSPPAATSLIQQPAGADTGVSTVPGATKTASSALDELLRIKEASDNRDYGKKRELASQLMNESPDDFSVERDIKTPGYSSVTHTPTNFRFHIPEGAVPSSIRLRDAMSKIAMEDDFPPLQQKTAAPGDVVSAFDHKGVVRALPGDVDYEMVSPSHQFSASTNLVPMPQSMKGARLTISAKYQTQALPLRDPEAPLVDSMDPETRESVSAILGRRLGMVNSPVSGKVASVADGLIRIRDDKGKLHNVETHNYFPGARKTYFHDHPLVKQGDTVRAGGPIARSNFVNDQGILSTGKNLRVAFAAGPDGGTFEDAISISESAAKKLTSSHMIGFDEDLVDGVETSKEKFVSVFPGVFTPEQLEKIGDDGLPKPGVTLNPGDPVMLALSPRALGSKDAAAGRLGKALRGSWRDMSQTWDKGVVGRVADSVKTRKSARVNVVADFPAAVGDKLCLTPDHEVLTDKGWVLIAKVKKGDIVYSINPETKEISLVRVSKAWSFKVKKELMYSLETTQVSTCATKDHKLLAKPRSSDSYSLIPAESLAGKRYRLKKDGEWKGGEDEAVSILPIEVSSGGRNRSTTRKSKGFVLSGLFHAWLCGIYASEGNIRSIPSKGDFGIEISQRKESGIQEIKRRLDEEGLHYTYQKSTGKFIILGISIMNHFSRFGGSANKKTVPAAIISKFTKSQAEEFLAGAMLGDGHVAKKSGAWAYHTTSKRLADDVQHISLLAGMSATIKCLRVGIDFEAKGGVIDGRQIVAKNDRYWVSIIRKKNEPEVNHGHIKTQSGQKEEWVEYTGSVHCIEVPGNHNFYVRRNGKTHWTGNSARQGAKGVLSRLVPDEKMPHTEDGEPIDIFINTAALIGRVNPAMVFEAMAGKVAEKTGQPVYVPPFMNEESLDFVQGLLDKHGISPTENIVNPTTGRTIPDVLVGKQYFQKLEHVSDSKMSARDEGSLDVNLQPTKGGDEGAKRMGGLMNLALISHGACFLPGTRIMTQDGYEDIKEIVKGRKSSLVACMNEKTCRIEYRRVIDWFAKSVPEEELVIVETNCTYRDRRGRKAARTKSIKCTRGHEFYTDKGIVQAGNLQPGDCVFMPGTRLSEDQYQLVLGTLMGDSSISKTGYLNCTHGEKQKQYLDDKFSLLDNVTPTKTSQPHIKEWEGKIIKTVRKRTRVHQTFCSLRSEWYSGKTKTPPPGVVERMGWRGIGAWFGDDGSCVVDSDGVIRGFRIHTEGFSKTAVFRLASELSEFSGLGWQPRSRKTPAGKEKWILSLFNGQRGCNFIEKWVDQVSPWLHPSLSYKVRKDTCGERFFDVVIPEATGHPEPCLILSVNPYKPQKAEGTVVYNITVDEHHNYFAGSILVGNTEVLRDAKIYRGGGNPEIFRRIRTGQPLPAPQTPYVYNKMLDTLRAAGVNVQESEDRVTISAMTDRDVEDLSPQTVSTPGTIDWKSGKPVENGLFDPAVFGGSEGRGWGVIDLPFKVPHPLMERQVINILGITKPKLRKILAGEETINGESGPEAIEKALSGIKVEELKKSALSDARGATRTKRDKAIKTLNVIRGLENAGIEPKDLMVSRVPVLPMAHRPIVEAGQTTVVSDANFLYNDLLEAVTMWNENKSALTGE